MADADLLADRLAREAAAPIEAMLSRIEAMMAVAGSLEELREMLLAAYPRIDATGLATVLAQAMLAAHAGGRAALDLESEAPDGG